MKVRHGLVLLPAAVLVAIACGDPSHLYVGRPYDEQRGCLESTAALDVVEGEAPKTCAPVCLVQVPADGGRRIYVSSMCAPYPFGVDVSGSDPACAAALAAQARRDHCLEDGGSSAPPPKDAAAE